jgi:phage tail protein X
MYRPVVLFAIAALAIVAGAARATEICATYSVAPGDTLRLIAERYYGTRDLSPIIYAANTGVIGDNPNLIEIGMELGIPCHDNMHIPSETAFLAVVTPGASGLKFVSRAGQSPFIGQDNTGVLPDILSAALRAGGYGAPLDIARPDTVSDVLRLSAAPEALLSFPWIRPDCGADPGALSPQSAYLCKNYTLSDPLYEITLGLFTRKNGALTTATTAADFAGKALCVPQFYATDILAQNRITATAASIRITTDLSACVAQLADGRIDAFVADYQSVASLGPGADAVADIPAFAQKTTLHAIAFSQNPAALETLKIANTGLKQILKSGQWFEIVNGYFSR